MAERMPSRRTDCRSLKKHNFSNDGLVAGETVEEKIDPEEGWSGLKFLGRSAQAASSVSWQAFGHDRNRILTGRCRKRLGDGSGDVSSINRTRPALLVDGLVRKIMGDVVYLADQPGRVL